MSRVRRAAEAPTRRTQEERRRATRAALLDACARQLATGGYAATTTTAVAEAAGLSRGALQHTFEGRSDLMVAVARDGYRRLVADLRAAAPTTGSTGERVAALVAAMLDSYAAPHAIAAYEVLLGERSNPEFMALHAEVLESAEADLDRLWLDVLAASGAPDASVRAARRVARAAVLGLVVRGVPLGDDAATAAALAQAVTALLRPQPEPARARPAGSR